MKKILIITVAAIALLIIAFAVFIKIYVTPERVKGFIVPTAEKALNRKVQIGDIGISIFKGISLNDFSIKEADQTRDFVKCKEFVLKFKLLPLLSKQVIIDELKLVSPVVKIERGPDGKYNFEGIGKKDEGVKEEKPDEAGGLPISLTVNRVEIQEAQFSLADAMKELPDVKSTADIDISLKSTDSRNIFSEGTVDLKLDEITLKKPTDKHIRDIPAALSYAVNYNLESKDIRVDKADLKIREILASINGDIKNLNTSPTVNIGVTIPKVKTAEVLALAALFADLKGLGLTGDIAAEIKLDGEIKKTEALKATGNIALDKVGITYNAINALLDGSVRFDETLMNIDLKATLDKNTAEIKGSVRDYMKDRKINLNIYSRQLSLDTLIPAGKPADKTSDGGGKTTPGKPAKEAAPPALKLTADGEIRIDSAVYRNMTMSDFQMQYAFRNNRLDIPRLTAKAGKGAIRVNCLADLSKPGYAYILSGNVDSLHADEVVNTFFPKARDTVFGLITFNLKMNGSGTLPESIKKNLAADADFSIKDGRLTGANITEGLAQFLSIKELETIELKQAKGTVRVINGIAALDTIFSSDDVALDPKGNIGLNETLDLAFDLKLSPRLTDKAMSSKIGQYIKSEEGWGTVPLKVYGTFAKPSYMVDIEKAGKRIIKKEADKYIDKYLDKQSDKKKKELEPVRDLLKGILK
ncbi:MAG: AsmA family protein [Nitrospiraceae bacterium]|nr:MAG: AsmA family protein [Nitrospiraceae bacterium]